MSGTNQSVRERPILFSGPMVRAILDGRKTQTRRVIKCCCNCGHLGRLLGDWALSIPPHQWDGESTDVLWGWTGDQSPQKGDFVEVWQTDVDDHASGPVPCPYGVPGERLWVRETWCMYPMASNDGAAGIIYRATSDNIPKGMWKPSIHMRRIHSRINLEITGLRVERLQDINETDARAEWAEQLHSEFGSGSFRDGFQSLWHKINGPDSWASNPWVWVIEFKKINS